MTDEAHEVINIFIHAAELALHQNGNEKSNKYMRAIGTSSAAVSKAIGFFRYTKEDKKQKSSDLASINIVDGLVEAAKLAISLYDLTQKNPNDKSFKDIHQLLCWCSLGLAVAKWIIENSDSDEPQENAPRRTYTNSEDTSKYTKIYIST